MNEEMKAKESTKAGRISDLLSGTLKSSTSIRVLSNNIKGRLLGTETPTGEDSKTSPEPTCFFDEVITTLYNIQSSLAESINALDEVNSQLTK